MSPLLAGSIDASDELYREWLEALWGYDVRHGRDHASYSLRRVRRLDLIGDDP